MTDSMKHIGGVLREPERLISRPNLGPDRLNVRCVRQRNGTEVCQTEEEWKKAGYLETTGPRGRTMITALCFDDYGEPVYPEFVQEDETTADLLNRVERDNARCPHHHDRKPRQERRFD